MDLMEVLRDEIAGNEAAGRDWIAAAALASGERCVLVTHGNLLTLILRSIDATVGCDFSSRLSNPDVFVVHVDVERPTGFSRAWNQRREGVQDGV